MTEESDPIPLDVNQMRDDVIEAYGLQRVNEPHTFYYDESNNIRRLHLKAVGLNVPEPQIYVLGGIAHLGPAKDLGFKALRDSLRLQPSVKEVKFEHVAKGDFLTVLTSRKLTVFLEWVLRANLAVHYIAMDPMYWATVDIIESASAESPAILAFGPQLKSDLYSVLRLDMPQLIAMLVRYGYPDVGPSGPEFMRELLEILECREDHLDHFNYYMLKGVLQMGARSNQLPFLENETPNQLIESFAPFVIHRLCLFKDSKHILDVEPFIAKRLDQNRFVDRDRELSLYRYAVSHDEPGIQISDVLVGLLAKCFSWVSRSSVEDILAVKAQLTDLQKINLRLLSELLDRSSDQSASYAQRVICLEDDQRGAALFF